MFRLHSLLTAFSAALLALLVHLHGWEHLRTLGLESLSLPGWGSPADVTTIVLNWSRVENVKLIASTLCTSDLDDVVKTVFVWNNSPIPLNQSDFSGCAGNKMRIFNSPENIYFQARFVACAQASTPYCFLQDDDYLVLPNIIRTLRYRISRTSAPSIHLLPPHEMLSSLLRTIEVPPRIHTSFAWLGHGAMIRREQAQQFLSLMQHLNASDEETKMVDNYFTILKNEPVELWFDQGIELGGGVPFTVGSEGEARNNRHIMQAARYLDAIMGTHAVDAAIPFTRVIANSEMQLPTPALTRAACRSSPCFFETNVALFPRNFNEPAGETATDILKEEKRKLGNLVETEQLRFLTMSPSNVVDGGRSKFCSRGTAKPGDYISLEFSSPVSPGSVILLTVDEYTEIFLRKANYRTFDGTQWVNTRTPFCIETTDGQRQCRLQWTRPSEKFVFELPEDEHPEHPWCIYQWIVQ